MINLDRVSKTYRQGGSDVVALDALTLNVPRGQFLSIMGPSGSGKSTLLHLIGGLDTPTGGTIVVDGRPLFGLSDDEITLFRRRRIGFVFQFFNLLPNLSAEENVALPLLLDGHRARTVRPKAHAMLDLVGLSHRRAHRPNEMSGGEMQRVAVARALVTDPLMLLADEPTGNLDTQTGEAILQMMRDASDRFGQTTILVTHDARAAQYGDRLVAMKDGRVVDDARLTSNPQMVGPSTA